MEKKKTKLTLSGNLKKNPYLILRRLKAKEKKFCIYRKEI